jgi:toxin ParE1/3/4
MNLVFNDEALAEYLEAVRWYAQQRQGLGQEFVAAVDHAASEILRHPTRFQSVGDDLRKLRMKRFPYHLYFRIVDEAAIKIWAVRHERQQQDLWRTRLDLETSED